MGLAENGRYRKLLLFRLRQIMISHRNCGYPISRKPPIGCDSTSYHIRCSVTRTMEKCLKNWRTPPNPMVYHRFPDLIWASPKNDESSLWGCNPRIYVDQWFIIMFPPFLQVQWCIMFLFFLLGEVQPHFQRHPQHPKEKTLAPSVLSRSLVDRWKLAWWSSASWGGNLRPYWKLSCWKPMGKALRNMTYNCSVFSTSSLVYRRLMAVEWR